MLYLKIPFEEKDEAKNLGAKWNWKRKGWYVNNESDYHKFGKWILKDENEVSILHDHFFIVIGKKECFRCEKSTDVIAFASDNHLSFYDDTPDSVSKSSNITRLYDYDNSAADEMMLIPYDVLTFSETFEVFLKREFNFYRSYSKTIQDYDYYNHCSHCGVIQGNFYLFESSETPFDLFSEEKIKKLKLMKVLLPHDYNLGINITLSMEEMSSNIFTCNDTFSSEESMCEFFYKQIAKLNNSFLIADSINSNGLEILV